MQFLIHLSRVRHKLLITIITSLAILLPLLFVGLYFSYRPGSHGLVFFKIDQRILSYAPTLLLTVLVATWRQIDYGTKSAAPWVQMRKGWSSAEQSVLLDYISNFQAVSLANSLKNRHVSVSVSICGFILLKIATIASTGLFTRSTDVRNTSISLSRDSSFLNFVYDQNDLTLLQKQSPVFTTWGLLFAGLDQPFGSTQAFAYDTFQLQDLLEVNSTASVVVGALTPSTRCEPVEVTISMAPENDTDINPKHQIHLTNNICSTSPGPIYALNPSRFVCPSQQLSGTIKQISCKDATGISQDNWRLITMTDILYQQSYNRSSALSISDPVVSQSSSTTIKRISSLRCQLSYTAGSANITFVGAPGSDDFEVKGARLLNQTTAMQSMSNANLTKLVDLAISAASDIFGTLVANTYAQEYPNTLLKLMAGNTSYDALLSNQSFFLRSAERTIQNLAVQTIDKHVRQPSRALLTASALSPQPRLVIEVEPAYIIGGSFLIIMCASFVLVVLRCKDKTGPQPYAILDMATVTKHSQGLMAVNEQLHNLTDKTFEDHLRGFRFRAERRSPAEPFAVTAMPLQDKPEQPFSHSTGSGSDGIWWTQMTMTRWFSSLTFLFALTVTIVLEVLQRKSIAQQGIIRVNAMNRAERLVVTRFAPALLTTLLATMFNCLDFNVLLMQPYAQMRSGMLGKYMLQPPPLKRLPISSYLHNLRHLNLAGLGSSSAAFVGMFLTVAVSGLFSIEAVAVPKAIDVKVLDTFVPIWNNSWNNDNGAAIMTSLTENLNLSYPWGTFETFYLPSLNFVGPESTSDDIFTESHVNLSTFAYQANLTCETADSDAYNVTVLQNKIQQSVTVSTIYPLPAQCLRGGPHGNESTLSVDYTFNIPLGENDSYVAKILDLHVGPYDSVKGLSAGELANSGTNDNPSGCPSLAFLYGHLSSEDLSQTNPAGKNIAVQICYQTIQRHQLNLTLKASPGQELKLQSAPVPIDIDASSEREVLVPGGNDKEFQFRIESHFDETLSFFNNSRNVFAAGSVGSPVVDRFFQGVLFGRVNTPLEIMKLQTTTDFQLMQERILGMYRRYMAQAMSLNMRIQQQDRNPNLPHLDADPTDLSGTLLQGPGATEARLVQHNSSKISLQIMVAAMVIGGLCALYNIRMNDLLPPAANPCTIWGQLSLWLGSSWCQDDDPVISTSHDGRGVKSAVSTINRIDEKLLETNTTFKLGWWRNRQSTGMWQRRYGIDVVHQQWQTDAMQMETPLLAGRNR